MSLSARTIIFVVVYVMVFINVAMDILTATGEKNKQKMTDVLLYLYPE